LLEGLEAQPATMNAASKTERKARDMAHLAN
jgi:hypothetical protein